jgi:CHAT domain-containing protein
VLSGKHSATEAAAAERELTTLTSDLEQIQSRIREASPQYAALKQPQPLGLTEIQTKVMDDSTVLLEYALGSEKSYLWAVTPSSIEVFDLPPRAEVEATARRMYELATARNHSLPKETPAARATRLRRADEAFLPAAAKAANILLAPVGSRIQNKRLLIVAEGVLQYLPFAALPELGTANPLIANHEIVTAPSASVIAVLRQETSRREPAEKEVAIFADPVFSGSDPRIARQRDIMVRTAAGRDNRSDPEAGGQDLVRLRFSRIEADEITRLAPAGAVRMALDFDANRDAVLDSDLGRYRIVHFATHSLLNNEHPELSSIVLSLFDANGRPQNGYLRLYDVYNLRLNAELVVLSACRTALGGEIKGEGLIGLTRGFLYAGSPRVAASLWEVDDRTTAELMKRFYEGMLGRGETPAAALRAAQLGFWSTTGWEAPYYWAAFTLEGEWR